VAVAEVNGARLWYDVTGLGEAVLLLHGGLGDSELWEPVVPLLADRFRTIRSDLRFYGRSVGPAAPWSWQEDVIALLDALGLERAALVGLSLGGKIALDVALAHPGRLWALALVSPALGGHDGSAYTHAQEAAYEEALAAGDLEAAMAIDLEVWAPLGVDDRIKRLWYATPEANPLPPGVAHRPPAGGAAKARLGELSVPTLVVTASHDPEGFREIGAIVARATRDARHVELDSDHYLTLREPGLLAATLLEFLGETAPTR